jgi:hypothetical protein
MASDADVLALHAELLAVEAVVIALGRTLAATPNLGPAVCAAFDEAESMMTGIAIRLGADAAPEATVGALRIIAEMRDAAIRDESVCGSR